jgi:hypothetical protein
MLKIKKGWMFNKVEILKIKNKLIEHKFYRNSTKPRILQVSRCAPSIHLRFTYPSSLYSLKILFYLISNSNHTWCKKSH